LGERDRFSTEWGFLPVDYLAKEKELEELLPKVELEFDRQFITGLRERISDHENEIQKLQKDYEDLNRDWGNHDRKVRLQNETEAAKSDFKNLEIDASILSLEEAFEKKWSPQTEEETIEQFERRLFEGNIQFLAAIIERFEMESRGSWALKVAQKRGLGIEETMQAAQRVHSQAAKSFFVKYGEVCPQANHFNVATK
jgi:DNA repair exonuclease SbcCD ATPase subunit